MSRYHWQQHGWPVGYHHHYCPFAVAVQWRRQGSNMVAAWGREWTCCRECTSWEGGTAAGWLMADTMIWSVLVGPPSLSFSSREGWSTAGRGREGKGLKRLPETWQEGGNCECAVEDGGWLCTRSASWYLFVLDIFAGLWWYTLCCRSRSISKFFLWDQHNKQQWLLLFLMLVFHLQATIYFVLSY